MIEFVTGDMFQADVEAIINTVNCVGVSGKGLALQFKAAYPDNERVYRAACKRGDVSPGRILMVPTGHATNPRWILNVPTKRHWREPSRLDDVAAGIRALVDVVRRHEISSVAVPPLGAGSGGLAWADVRTLVEEAAGELPAVRWVVFEPGRSTEAVPSPRTVRPKWTPARALFVRVMDLYCRATYALTRLEVQKLAYFLQEAGQPLKLRFVKHHYGPYADNLRPVLQRMEGHFIDGYGDGTRSTRIRVRGDALGQARDVLAGDIESEARLDRVARLIEGFETPYSMELLATVHWVATREAGKAPGTADLVLAGVRAWSERKADRFQAEHVVAAWNHLKERGWLDAPSS